MPSSRIYCKNDFVVAKDPRSTATVEAKFNGRAILTPQGVASPGGLVLLQDKLTTSKMCHEVEIVASATDGLAPGDRVIVYIGGDDGSVNANGISAFPELDGVEHFVIPQRFVWAVIRDGEVLPRGRIILTERDDGSFKRHTFGTGGLLHLPEAQLAGGMSATGSKDPTQGGSRVLDSVTALYERVYRTGPAVPEAELARGQVVCFSPSYSSAKLTRRMGDRKQHLHLVDSDEVYFVVAD